eukprot:6635251-Pyramimonas_sp.AAC.1
MAAQGTSQPRARDARDTAVPRVERSHNTGRPCVILGLGSRAQVSPACVRKCSSTVTQAWIKCSPGVALVLHSSVRPDEARVVPVVHL